MIYDEICDVVECVKKDKIVRASALCVFAASILTASFFSTLAALIILVNYFLGYIVCWSLINYQSKVSISLQRLASFYRSHSLQRKPSISACGICSDKSCKRHPIAKNSAPWKNLHIQKDLNSAVEHFYNKIIETFIESWYLNFTTDETFVNELRHCLRYATASIVRKFLSLDVGHVIANKLVPCVIRHVDDYMYMQQIANLKNTDINNVTVEYLGNRLHIAVTNRQNEISYLRNLSSCLLPKVFPSEYLKCRNYSVLIREIVACWVFLPLMDVLADPNIINYLVIYGATYKPKPFRNIPVNPAKVEFMCNFSNKIRNASTFSTDLQNIRKNTDLLYAFMQFLKREGSVHFLQFCLDVDEFNNKLLTPDLSKKQLENLHAEATTLYKEYFDAENASFIGCSTDIAENFKKLLNDGVHHVAKFRTSEPLYQAYEHALNILENELLPPFFHSNEFFSYTCGSKVTPTYSKSSINKGRKYYDPISQSTVSKISSSLGRIKGALRTNQPIEGAIYVPEIQTIENGTVEDMLTMDCSNIHRDLSTWRISISSIDAVQIGTKDVVLYNVNIQRLEADSDAERKSWTVQRKDLDFYTLRVKLIEFHGETEICNTPYPPRRASTPIEVRRLKYEEFLRKLLQKAALKGSDLLHTFLTSEQDFTLLVNAGVTGVGDIGNIYQSVAYKLRKEKGQHLDSFMNTFMVSTGRSKLGKFEWAEIGDELDAESSVESHKHTVPKTYKSSIFNDNYGVTYGNIQESTSSPFNSNSLTESIFYLLKHIFKVPNGILRLYAAICSVGQHAVDSLARMYIAHKLKSSLSESNLAYLVTLLEGVAFSSHTPLTKEEMIARRNRAFTVIDSAVPSILTKILGNDFKVGFTSILELLQNPLYNKQLVYNLVDVLIAEMYPELNAFHSEEITT